MRITRVAAVVALSTAALVASAVPGSAHPLLGAFVGTATTSGTWAPVGPTCGVATCPSFNTWTFVSNTDVVVHPATVPTVGSGRLSGAGSFDGWCGRSEGTGSFTAGSDTGTVAWQSAGTIIVLVGDAPGHTAVAAVVAARAAANTGNCVTAAATAFDVVGVASAH